MNGRIRLVEVLPGQKITLAGIEIEFIEVFHSTLGCYCLCMDTPQGRIVHSGTSAGSHPSTARAAAT